MNLKYKKVIK